MAEIIKSKETRLSHSTTKEPELLRHWKSLKAKYPNTVMLIADAEFFYSFGEDAPLVSAVCKDKPSVGDLNGTPITCFAKKFVDAVVAELIKNGYRVATGEQTKEGAATETAALAPAAPVAAGPSDLTIQKRRDLYNKSKSMMSDSIAFGIKRFVYMGAAISNIKEFELYKVDEDTPTFKAYLESVGLDKSDAYKYANIGNAIRQHLASTGVMGEDWDGLIQQKDIEQHMKPALDNLRGLTFRQVVDLSKRLDVFHEAMNGAELVKLLPVPEKSDAQIIEEKIERSERQEFDDYMRDVAKANGWKWNTKVKPARMEHPDGTALTDEEYGRVTAPKSALKPWLDSAETFLKGLDKAKESIILHAPSYIRYATAIRNDEVTKQVLQAREQVRKSYEEFDSMLENLYHLDEKRVKEIHKHGLEE